MVAPTGLPVHRALRYCVLSLTLLAAYSSQARAEYISLSAEPLSEASASMSQPVQRDGDSPADKLVDQLPIDPVAWGHAPQSGGFGGTSSAPDSGGVGQQIGCNTTPPTPRIELVGRLFLTDLSYRPPPFPSRLFRPPRIA
jgi:hypothetical protein